MTLFGWLLVGHLIGDFLVQTRWMADNKAKYLLPLIVHSAVYTAAVALAALQAGGLSPAALALIFFSHMLLDKRFVVELWARHITGADQSMWLKTMIDQSWHIIILALATQL